jgi:hypothetical protein
LVSISARAASSASFTGRRRISGPNPPARLRLQTHPDWPLDSSKVTKLPEHFIAMAKRQKAQDEATETGKRVVVGGSCSFA